MVSRVAENTRRIIAEKGFKQKAVAARAGIPAGSFSAMMNNRKVIRDVDIISIANALSVTPNELFGFGPESA